MKYRIKKVSHKDGEVKYFAQYYKGFFSRWLGINWKGEKCNYKLSNTLDNREEALKVIDLCDKGKGVVTTIEFEYINK